MRQRLLQFLPFFSVLSIVQTWPLARVAGSRALDLGDGLLNVWLLAAVSRRMIGHPLSVFDINMYYPFRGALATLDHQFSTALLLTPLALITDNALLPANVFTVASFAMAGVCTAWLVIELTDSTPAALLAGCIYAFSPMRFENITRTHVLANCWLPLTLLVLHRYLQRPTWTRLLVATGGFLLLALGSWYYTAIGGLAVAVMVLSDLAQRQGDRGAVGRQLLAGAGVAAVVLALVAWPYLRVSREFLPNPVRAFNVSQDAPARTIDRAVDREVIEELSAPVENYLAASPTYAPWSRRLASLSPMVGARYFPGLVAAIFAAIALFVVFRQQVRASGLVWPAVTLCALAVSATTAVLVPVLLILLVGWLFLRLARTGPADRLHLTARMFLVLGGIGVLLSFGEHVKAFGTTLGHGVYPATIPPFSMLRASSRFGALFSMSAAVLAGIGYVVIARRIRTPAMRYALVGLALLVANVELAGAPVRAEFVGRLPDAYEWLKQAPPGPVVDFPIHGNPRALFWSLSHRQLMVNGAGALQPAPFHRLEEYDDLSPEMLEYLREYFHPRYLVVNSGLYTGPRAAALDERLAMNRDTLTLAAQFGARRIFEITGPSRGTSVLRSYPAWMVAGKSSVTVDARIDAPPARGTAALQVWGDGRLLASTGAASPASGVVTAALPSEMPLGVNVEVMADYVLGASNRLPIGQTGRLSPADIALTVTPDRARLEVNGHVWIGEKGYTVVALGPETSTPDVRAFNTSWSTDESHALARYLDGLPQGTTVAVATFFDASRALTDDAVRALSGIGMSGDLRGRFQWAHAAIGVRGAAPGTALESIGPSAASARVGTPAALTVVVNRVELK